MSRTVGRNFLGGRVIFFDKPYKDIYDLSLDRLSGVTPPRILVIGSSLNSDIAGANRCGLDKLPGATGIDWRELSTNPGDVDELITLCHTADSFPSITAKGLIW